MEFIVDKQRVFATSGSRGLRRGLPAIVFVHGSALNRTIWQMHTRHFAKRGYNVVAMDLPGHGRSGGTALTTVEALAEWLLRVLHELELAEVSLVGHSLGSLAVLEAAARAKPGHIPNLVLLGTAVPMLVAEPLPEAAKGNDHSAIDMLMSFGHAYNSRLSCNLVAGVAWINTAVRLMELTDDGVLYADLNACNEYRNGLNAAQKIDFPVAVIAGSKDPLTPLKRNRDLRAALADVSLIEIPDYRHLMFGEQPEATHSALVEALAGC